VPLRYARRRASAEARSENTITPLASTTHCITRLERLGRTGAQPDSR